LNKNRPDLAAAQNQDRENRPRKRDGLSALGLAVANAKSATNDEENQYLPVLKLRIKIHLKTVHPYLSKQKGNTSRTKPMQKRFLSLKIEKGSHNH
jgi:hypothetical protein